MTGVVQAAATNSQGTYIRGYLQGMSSFIFSSMPPLLILRNSLLCDLSTHTTMHPHSALSLLSDNIVLIAVFSLQERRFFSRASRAFGEIVSWLSHRNMTPVAGPHWIPHEYKQIKRE